MQITEEKVSLNSQAIESVDDESIEESRRELATVQRITSLEPIEGADKIEVATVLGWHVVVQKGLHQVGSLALYVEVDALLPETRLFEWMRPYDFRVKTIRLRGQISQGILVPIREVEDYIIAPDGCTSTCDIMVRFNEGEDLTKTLGIKKYVRPESKNGPSNVRKGRPSNWPSWISKTDELRIQGVYKYAENHLDKEFFVTEKLDGESITVYLNKEDEFGVCSRNNDLEPDPNDKYWKVAIGLKFEEKLRKAYEDTRTHYAIQGELVGPGHCGNKLDLKDKNIYVYNVYNIDTQQYLNFEPYFHFCSKYGFETVPLWFRGLLKNADGSKYSCDDLVKTAIVKSKLNNNAWAEGLVFRTTIEGHDRKLGRISFKAINPEWDLKHNKRK
jgi:RNA ligase (TIGR02306 family)